ncbi:MAG: hypothetical protein E4G94_01975 [ANME-2 cluster archaeon]|nr:MAG: hypothetical protein E4G94_01975 [ANME-2 cluster archaeon]
MTEKPRPHNSKYTFGFVMILVLFISTVFSGCIDTDATQVPDDVEIDITSAFDLLDASFDEIKDVIETKDNPLAGTDINALNDRIKENFEFDPENDIDDIGNGMSQRTYDVNENEIKITYDKDRVPQSIEKIFSSEERIKAYDTDRDPEIDEIRGLNENGEEVFSYPKTATSKATQLGDALSEVETPANNNPGEVYKLIRDGNFDQSAAEKLLSQDVSSLKIAGDLGPTLEKPRKNEPYTLEYFSDEFKERFGLEKYKEYYNENGKLSGIAIIKDTNNQLLAADDIDKGNVFIDGKISRIKGSINGEAFKMLEE